MKLNKTPLALAIALALTHAAVFAEDATLPSVTVTAGREAAYNPSTATSATKIDAPLRDIPQTVNVVPQELLRDQGASSMEDAMKGIPGVGLSHGDGQRDQVTIRGFTAIADQFIDGMRDDALYFRDLSNIEQVEVIKGPASVLYGRGSSGGMINRITKKPGINRSEAGVTFGSWSKKRGEFDVARNLQDSGVAFRVTGAKEDSDSYRNQQFLKREALSPSVLWKLDADTSLLVQGEYLADRRLTDFGIPSYKGEPVDVDSGTYYGAANARDVDFSQARVKSLSVALDHRINANWSLRNAFRRYDYSLNRNNTLVGSVNETAQTASLSHANIRREEDGYFNQTELTQRADFFGMQHQLLYGVEIGKQDKDLVNRSQTNVATVNLFKPALPVLQLAANAAPGTDNLGIMKNKSVYVQDLATLTPQWKLLAGVRYDDFSQETRERRVGQKDLERTDRAWSPRAGLVYQPSGSASYYASFSKSFQPSGETFALAANNAAIEPEQTTNKEVGAKLDLFGGQATLGASLFRLQRTGIKATDPVTNVVMPVGTQRTDGLELTFSGELGQGWQVSSGLALLDAEIIKSIARDDGQQVQGKRPTLTPKHSASLWLNKALGGGWFSGAGLNYQGDRFANPGNTTTLPGYTVVDAMLAYRTASFDVQLNVNNLFDREYMVSGHGSSKLLNLPGAPRNARITARYRF
ncbi:TonB-dependent receptor [Pseudoduganella violaceinigra]|uniref:TonB-dependent receptor n=1 Tax=Pseudoduganella violaceinigra TaxID=246602 RepID=UPI00040B59E4|nr:TonB-dependent siderophore receptor [Pseudoduganella violaceinigra]